MDGTQGQSSAGSGHEIQTPDELLRVFQTVLQRFRLAVKDCGVWPGEPTSCGTDFCDYDDLWHWLVSIGSVYEKLPYGSRRPMSGYFVDKYGWEWWAVESDRVVERLLELVDRVKADWVTAAPGEELPDNGTRARVYFCSPVGAPLRSQMCRQQLSDEADEPLIVDVIARPLSVQEAATIDRCLERLEQVAREAERATRGTLKNSPLLVPAPRSCRPRDPRLPEIAAYLVAERAKRTPWKQLPKLVADKFGGEPLSVETLKGYPGRYLGKITEEGAPDA